MLRLVCLVSAALMISVFVNFLLMWKYLSSKSNDRVADHRNRSSRFPEAAYESFSTSEISSEEEDVETEPRFSMKKYLQNFFHLRTSQYTKLNSTDELYEMDNLNE